MGASLDLAVSTVILALLPGTTAGCGDETPQLHLPLVRRTREPFDGRWALPGGWVTPDERLSSAARRTLAETTGLRPSYLEQLYTFGAPHRSPTGRVVSVVYTALVRAPEAAAVEVGPNVRWAPADRLPDTVGELAFDHAEIVDYALWRLRTKVSYAAIAQHFLGELFTLAELRGVHEAVLGKHLDPANFRRSVAASGAVEATDEVRAGAAHRPARLYRAVLPPGGATGGYPPWQSRPELG
ncbi:NUDIX hydrolase [Streptomyces sp. NP160]|uniref:NUDIX hydrolase n=1 Tax=Streptomyces sp. NP160 TaxID=2586637 RepID=UPI001118395E|nr:NUDIX domain-containing protein [Streptomyces sp. NP160]TNM64570.1 NUDIX hydrolase [Streptomyces sp. NP160]